MKQLLPVRTVKSINKKKVISFLSIALLFVFGFLFIASSPVFAEGKLEVITEKVKEGGNSIWVFFKNIASTIILISLAASLIRLLLNSDDPSVVRTTKRVIIVLATAFVLLYSLDAIIGWITDIAKS